MKKIAIMTAGGDCAGLNSVIKTVVLSAINRGIVVVGIIDGYIGFVERKYKVLDKTSVFGIESQGGTILGSSNKECPFHYPSDSIKENYEDRVKDSIEALKSIGVEGVIIIGGDGTLDSARVIHEAGMPVVGIPKTIDNDMVASNPTIGFNTAVGNAVDAIRKLKTTAYSHRRVMVVEIMGRTSGYLTLHSGFAAGADIILLPELDYRLDAVCQKVKEVMESGKRYVIIAASEAAKEKGKDETIARIIKDSFEQKRYGGIAQKLAEQIEQITGYEARSMVLGHLQRGGEPCTADILLGARLGDYALKLLLSNHAGCIVGAYENALRKIEFPKTRMARILDLRSNDIYRTAKDMGTSFGM
ncbi:MAG: ATP-dependent 6-phosphofructokinase [Clostridia bacterium]